jgi:hypothetical protein
MKKVITFRTTILGFISWLIPFAVSFMFFDPSGQLLIPQPLFKSIMVVVSGALGAYLLVLAFRKISPLPGTGLALGLYWLALNLALDLAILVPLTKMPIVTYLYDIGIRYLVIPAFSTAMGVAARDAVSGTRTG